MSIDTSSACVPLKKVSCVITNNNLKYNITPLALLNQNYLVKDESNNLEFSLNVCQNLITNQKSQCSAGSSACMRNLSEPNYLASFKSVGEIAEPSIENGELYIEYKNGNLDMKSLSHYKTRIRFKCSYSNEKLIFMRRIISIFEFEWSSKYACPMKHKKRHLPCISADCNFQTNVSLIDTKKAVNVIGGNLSYNYISISNNQNLSSNTFIKESSEKLNLNKAGNKKHLFLFTHKLICSFRNCFRNFRISTYCVCNSFLLLYQKNKKKKLFFPI